MSDETVRQNVSPLGERQRRIYPNVLRQPCPFCGARATEPCENQADPRKDLKRPHPERQKALKQAIFDIDNYADEDD